MKIIGFKMKTKKHYQERMVNGLDVIALAELWNLNPCEFNILKYLLRNKGQDIEDMQKIQDYASRQEEILERRIINKRIVKL
tara:strand:+ start:639 stop:884 length:246 start_codon:yes stop_codon:yes gene_type:complete